MLRRIMLCIVLLWVICFPPKIRATPFLDGSMTRLQVTEHALRRPTADDYLRALPLFASQQPKVTTDDYATFDALRRTIGYELNTRFLTLQNASFETLYNAINVMPRSPYGRRLDTFANSDYQTFVITTWLRENNIDLAAYREVQFKDYNLTITPVDFNGDGVPELIVEVRYQNETSAEYYHEFWVLQRDSTQAIGYRRIKTPLPIFDSGCGFYVSCGGDGQTLRIEDLNGDGLPEWMFAVGGECGSGRCGGWLLVMGWRNDELVDLAQSDWSTTLNWEVEAGGGGNSIILPPNGTWTFTNEAGISRIIQRRTFFDNRNCQVTYTNTFTWDRIQDKYISDARTTAYVESAGCALRQGEEAINQERYPDAITAYQRAIALLLPDSAYNRQARQYAKIRLMLAYVLNGQDGDALALKHDLSEESPESAILRKLLSATASYDKPRDAVRLCSGLYTASQHYYPSDDDSYFWQFAPTEDVPTSFNYGGGDVDPRSSGCDLDRLLTKLLSSQPLSDVTILTNHLTQLGIDTVAHVQIDFNGDGNPDELFWMNNQPDWALIFTSHADTYHFELDSEVMAPNRYTQFGMISLPDNSGTALVRVGFDEPSSHPEVGEACGHGKPLGSVEFWPVKMGHLNSSSYYLLCEQRTIAQIFATPSVLQAWDTADYRGISTAAIPTAFVWDGYNKTYMTPPPATNVRNDTALECSEQPYNYCGFGLSGTRALAAFSTTLDQPPAAPSFFLAAVRYRRALLLESLGKFKAALADYVEISTDYPRTAWAALAELHFCSCIEF